MTDPTYTHLGLIVDRSGSMQSIADDMNGAIRHLQEEQIRQPGILRWDVWAFDQLVEHRVRNRRVDDQAHRFVQPRGSTALYDAIGEAVTELGDTFRNLPEQYRPGHVIVVIVTDGEENASHEYTLPAVKALIEQQQNVYGWEFVFLGANVDAFKVGASVGIRPRSTMQYAATGQSVTASFAAASAYMSTARSGGTAAFTDEERDAASR